MPKSEKYTVIVLPEGQSDRVRRFEISGRLMGSVGVLAALILIVSAVGVAGFYVGVKSSDELARLRDANTQYEKTISAYEATALELDARLQTLEDRQDRMKHVYQFDAEKAAAEGATGKKTAAPAEGKSGVGGRGGPEGGLVGHQSPSMGALLPINSLLAPENQTSIQSPIYERVAQRLSQLGNEQLQLQSHMDAQREELSYTPSIRPVNGGWVSSSFGTRISPFTEMEQFHNGLDISAERGSPIYATGGGTIRYAGAANGMGLMIDIDHGNGLRTRYGHCDKLHVRRGDKVSRGDIIGDVGMTGNTTGPHVHYEVLKNAQPVDPKRYIID